jgi:hypothetical protein
MPFVLDASVAAAWAFEDGDHPAAARALGLIENDSAIVLGLWWFEVRNALLSSEIGRRTTRARALMHSCLISLNCLFKWRHCRTASMYSDWRGNEA